MLPAEALNSFVELKMFVVEQNLDCFPTEALGLRCHDGHGRGGRGGRGTRQHFRHSQVVPSFFQLGELVFFTSYFSPL
jgi:hypothetical protein